VRPPARGTYAVWAPIPQQVRLVASGADGVRRTIAMTRDADAWWHPDESLPAGLDYGFLLDDDSEPLPDPRSPWQPEGVHRLSRHHDASAYSWGDSGWTGRQLGGGLIYEAHVGTFTPAGTFAAMIEKLPHLVSLGVGFLELLPVNTFNGEWNWGYDGVGWWAVHEPYGGPDGYLRLVDACHEHGIGVIQDVVYNHLGPSGNYLPRFGPYLSDERANTWGSSVNLDGEDSAGVREMIVANALMWLRDRHVDGLRLDAVHALHDSSRVHLLQELAIEVDALSAQLNRPLTLIAESDLNDPRLITPRDAGGYGLTAQWSDDFHHAVHANATGEAEGYYADFADMRALKKVYDEGFFHNGTWSTFRDRPHGRTIDTGTLPSWRLVTYAQNHDQIGNRARGDRLGETLDADQLACIALIVMTAPFTPMLFQGEEWAASTPFAFFTSHPEPELARATAEGRLAEFERMGWDPEQVPDPQDEATFLTSKLDWDEPGVGEHARILELHRRLAQLRRERPELTRPSFGRARTDGRLLVVDRDGLRIAVNLGDDAIELDEHDELGGVSEVLIATRDDVTMRHLPGWSGMVGTREPDRPNGTDSPDSPDSTDDTSGDL
jgi:maltooligosyltrehalose trehalohydrolase